MAGEAMVDGEVVVEDGAQLQAKRRKQERIELLYSESCSLSGHRVTSGK